MLQSNGKIRNFSKLLITCSFLSFLAGEVKAVDFTDVFEDDSDVQKTLTGSIRDVLKEKAVKKKDAYRLSNKGVLTTYNNRYFREFLMIGDGNCALYSMGTNHAAANALFLANANNPIVRNLAHQEIVDEFDNLPLEMQVKQNYIDLRAALTNIQELRDLGLEDDEELTADIIAQENLVRQQIQHYASSQETYTDYVNYALVNGHFMRFRQSVGGDQRTYFIDALAHLLNKSLTIWSQVDPEGRIIARHPGGNNGYLIPSHHYERGGGQDGRLNLIHRGNHFNRLVPTTDAAALAIAAQEEEEAINISAFADLNYGLLKNTRSIEYHFNKMIMDNDQFSEEDKEKAHAKIEALKKKKFSEKERVSQKELKAYCVAFIAGSKLAKEELQKDANIDVEKIKQGIDARYNKMPPAMRTNGVVVARRAKELEDAEGLAPKKAVAMAEIQKIDHQISVFEKVSNLIREVISEDDIFAALSTTIFTIGQENEALMGAIERKKAAGSVEKVERLEKEVEDNISRKVIFEKLYPLYQKYYRENVQKRLQFNLDKSKTRVKTWLNKKQTLDVQVRFGPAKPPIQLATDFEGARIVLERVTQAKRQENVPYLNPEYIMHDPYLLTHNRDVHTEYPEQITNKAWDELSQEVVRNITQYLRMGEIDDATRQDVLQSSFHFTAVLQKAAIDAGDPAEARKHTLRKRIKRVLDTLLSQVEEGDDQARLSAYATFARLMTQNVNRCIDGVELGVDQIEQDLIFSNGGREVFVEHTVSKILTNDKHDFIRQHSCFGGGHEEKTEIPALLLQRMRYPLSLRGEPTNIAYPGYAKMDDLNLRPDMVMERYLQGDPLIPAFEARTPEKFVSLLYDAYEQGINKSTDEEKMFSNQELADFACYDTRLSPLYQAFGQAFEDGEVIESEYFEVRNDRIGYKRVFFEYMLKRLGYIIDPQDPSINILLSEKSQEVLKALDIANLFNLPEDVSSSSPSSSASSSSSPASSSSPSLSWATGAAAPVRLNPHSFTIVRDDIKGRGLTTPFSFRPTQEGSFEISGEGTLFYQLLPKPLMDMYVGQKLLLEAEIKSETPGGYLQYFNGNERVMSNSYPGGNGWQKLQLEFTVKDGSRCHIIYPLVMPPKAPGSKIPVVEVKSIKVEPRVEQRRIHPPLELNPGSFAIVRDDIKGRGLTTPFSFKPTQEGLFEVTGEGTLFYQLLPKALMDTLVGQRFLLEAEIKSETPGGYLQYFNGNERVMSDPYPGGNGWQKLQLEFTVKSDSRYHIVYPLVMPPKAPGSAIPVVEIRNINFNFAS